MKKVLLLTMAAAMMCTGSALAQNRVKNLYADASELNVSLLQDAGQTVQVSRYLFAGYNTLCLPLSLSADQLAAAARDVKIERLAAIRQEGSTLCLYFTECTAQGLEAGVPYLLYSPTAQYLRARTSDAEAVGTELKTIRMSDNEGNQIAFSSSWATRTKDGLYGIPAKQNVQVLESVLTRTSTQSFLPTRCGISWESQAASATELEIRHVASLSDVTAISHIAADQQDGQAYDLQGRRVSSAKTGIVIKNGKKVAVRANR